MFSRYLENRISKNRMVTRSRITRDEKLSSIAVKPISFRTPRVIHSLQRRVQHSRLQRSLYPVLFFPPPSPSASRPPPFQHPSQNPSRCTLIAIRGRSWAKSPFATVFLCGNARSTLRSRIMKLESCSICEPCGAIFFNYSRRSSMGPGSLASWILQIRGRLFQARHSENAIVRRERG